MRRLWCSPAPAPAPIPTTRWRAGLGGARRRRDSASSTARASVGLMGTVADAALEAGGERRRRHPAGVVDARSLIPGVADLRVVGIDARAQGADGRPGRRVRRAARRDGDARGAVRGLPWTQLGLHSKPLGLLDVRCYYAKLAAFLDHAVAERFVTVEHREMLVVEQRAGGSAGGVQALAPPARSKWMDPLRP